MSNVTATAEHAFAGLSAEQVYDAWIKPDEVRAWMETQLRVNHPGIAVTRVEIDPAVGGKFLFADSRDGSEAWGYYKTLERPRTIAFSWFVSPEEEAEDNSLVTLEIEARGDGCLVVASHEMDAEWAEYMAQTAAAWKSMLAAIQTTLSAR